MRKLLLASAAIMGASGGLAFAQAPAHPNQGQLAGPYGAGPAANNNNNAWGTANTPTGGADAGLLSTIYAPNVDAVPAPGTVVIRLNGRVESGIVASYTNFDHGVTAAGVANGYKVNPLGVYSYARLYPGFDGLAANGLRYGAAIELRENFNSGVFSGSQTTLVSATSTATSPSANTSAETFFVRRAFTYLAADKVGIVRFGQTDGVIGLFDNCIFTSGCWDAGIGNFNGGALESQTVQGPFPLFVFLAQAGAEYANQKIVYLSPQYFGFDFGVQYAPSMGNSLQSSGVGVGCTQASASCIGLTSGNDATRWYNQAGAGLRYQQTFGPVDVKAYGFYETASKEDLTTNAYATPNQARLGATLPGGAIASAQNVRYDNLSFRKAGVAITAFNVTAAADYIGGAVNGQLSMKPRGGAPTNAVVTGLTYANGPVTLGAEVEIIDTQGDARLVNTSQRHEFGAAFGGSYKLAPGVQLVGEYNYYHRHQGGFDFATGALGNATAVANNNGTLTRDAYAHEFLFSTVLVW